MNENKVILISVDGMRPDGFLACGNPYIEKMMDAAAAEEWKGVSII